MHDAPAYFRKPHVVYRLLAADGSVLYIGATSDLKSRLANHKARKPWYHEVASVESEEHQNRWAATSAERDAIQGERPRYNFNHNRGHGVAPDGRTRRHARQTIEAIARKNDSHPFQNPNSAIVHPYALAPMFSSAMDGCLSHRTRYGTLFLPDVSGNRRIVYHAQCGTTNNNPVLIEPRDEFFMCRRCFAVCEQYDVDTLGMVPATGCEVSGGVRGKGRRSKAVA